MSVFKREQFLEKKKRRTNPDCPEDSLLFLPLLQELKFHPPPPFHTFPGRSNNTYEDLES